MKMPASVKIGSQVWSVTEQKRKHSVEDHYGFTTAKDCSIVIDAEMPEGNKRVTLLHEILHAIRFTFAGSYKPPKATDYSDWEHYFIGVYEEPLLLVLRDNPDLLKYLTTPL